MSETGPYRRNQQSQCRLLGLDLKCLKYGQIDANDPNVVG